MQKECQDNMKRHKTGQYLLSQQMKRENFERTTKQLIAGEITHR
jgi:hypothetical protein